MNIIEVLWDRLFGKPVVLTIMETSVRISQGRKAPEYELPKNWQGYKYLSFRFRAGLSADGEAAFYDSAGTEKLGALGGQSLCSF